MVIIVNSNVNYAGGNVFVHLFGKNKLVWPLLGYLIVVGSEMFCVFSVNGTLWGNNVKVDMLVLMNIPSPLFDYFWLYAVLENALDGGDILFFGD